MSMVQALRAQHAVELADKNTQLANQRWESGEAIKILKQAMVKGREMLEESESE